MTADPRIAPLSEALIKGSYLNGSWFDHEEECAAAILAALPPDWCGHRPDPLGICQLRCGHHGPHDTDLPPADDEARLRAIEEAARDIAGGGWIDVDGETGNEWCHWCDGFPPKHNKGCEFVALRAALGSER